MKQITVVKMESKTTNKIFKNKKMYLAVFQMLKRVINDT